MNFKADLSFDLASIRRVAIWALICGLIAAIVTYVVAKHEPKKYTTSASLLFNTTNYAQAFFNVQSSSTADSTDPAEISATDLGLVGLPNIARRTSAALGGRRTTGEVEKQVTVASPNQSSIVSVSATDKDPQVAAEMADAYARAYIAFSQSSSKSQIVAAQRLVQREIAAMTPAEKNSSQGRTLTQSKDNLALLSALQTGNAQLVQTAKVPSDPTSPRPKTDAIIGFILGAAFGLTIAFLRDRLDTRIRSVTELEEIYGRPVLAVIPQTSTTLALEASTEPGGREPFQMLQAQLRYFNVDQHLKSILVTSPSPGEGKSTVAWNLAVTVAQSTDSRVLLLEADLRRPTQASRHGLRPGPGLTEMLADGMSSDVVVQRVPVIAGSTGTDADRLDVIVAGAMPPNPTALLESASFMKLLDRLEDSYDLVVVDSPPTSFVPDALPLVGRVSGVIAVADLTSSTRHDASALSQQLANLGASVLGSVANRTRKTARYYDYYYAPDRPRTPGESEAVGTSGASPAADAGVMPAAGAVKAKRQADD